MLVGSGGLDGGVAEKAATGGGPGRWKGGARGRGEVSVMLRWSRKRPK
jgi:hypothetical protein